MAVKRSHIHIEADFWFFAALAFAAWISADAARLLIAAAVHEAGHIAALYLFGGRVRSLAFTLSGVRIRPCFKIPPTIYKEMIMSASGPAAGVLFSVVAYAFSQKRLAIISAGLSLFNMMPVYGLDGYVLFSLWKSRRTSIYREKLVKNNKAKGRFAQKQEGRIDHLNKKEKRSKKVSKTR